MLDFQRDIDLKPYTTFGISCRSNFFVDITSDQELLELVEHKIYRDNKVLWLGGGSNMLLRQNWDGLTIKISLEGKKILPWSQTHKVLACRAGENWHKLVLYSLENNLGGLENLSLIPGNAGTAPMQNIGAYGVELKDSFHRLRAFDLQEKSFRWFDAKQCDFGYRHSFFKAQGKDRYVITDLELILSANDHQLHLDYGAIRQELKKQQLEPTIHHISKAVCTIRQSKLPDPKEIGNSGSFFKNPVVNSEKFHKLNEEFPDLVAYQLSDKEYKLAAGWLIEKAGWKGYRKGDAGVHNKQALVLVNYNDASGEEIYQLSRQIQESISDTFAVELEAEVNII